MSLPVWQRVLLGAAVPSLVVVGWWLLHGTSSVTGQFYAYDTGTKELYATSSCLPPLDAPSGPAAGVLAQAVIFDGERTPTVVYLTTFTPEAHEFALKNGTDCAEVLAGTLVRRPEDTEWTPTATKEGRAIRAHAADLANGRTWQVAIP